MQAATIWATFGSRSKANLRTVDTKAFLQKKKGGSMLIGDWGQFEISLRTRKEASFTKCTLLIVVPFSWMVKLIWKFVQY